MPYLRLVFEGLGETVLYLKKNKVTDALLRNVPFSSKVIRWKEEVYFATPVNLEKVDGGTALVKPGTVGFWTPENSLALFYGNNQPYGEVLDIGYILGPLHYLRWIEDGSEVRVEEYKDYGREAEVAAFLRNQGIPAATRVWEEYPSVVVTMVNNYFVGAEIFVEDYGFILESTPLFFYDQCIIGNAIFESMKRLVKEPLRLDLNEEGYVILSAYLREKDKIPITLISISASYNYVMRSMASKYALLPL